MSRRNGHGPPHPLSQAGRLVGGPEQHMLIPCPGGIVVTETVYLPAEIKEGDAGPPKVVPHVSSGLCHIHYRELPNGQVAVRYCRVCCGYGLVKAYASELNPVGFRQMIQAQQDAQDKAAARKEAQEAADTAAASEERPS